MSLTTRNPRYRNRKRSNRRNNGKYCTRTTLRFESLGNRRLLAGLDCAPLNDVSGGDPLSPAAEIAPSQESVGDTQGTAMTTDSLSRGGQFVGTVNAVKRDGTRIRVQGGDGRTTTFKTDMNTAVVDRNGNPAVDRNGNPITINQLHGLKVGVQSDGNHRAIRIILLTRSMADTPAALPSGENPVQLPVDNGAVSNPSVDAVAGDSLSKGSKSFVGTVKEVDIDDMRIRVQQGEGGRAKTFKVDKDTQVVNRNGNAVNLDEIEGASVRVQADRNGRAIKITVLRFSMSDTPVALPGGDNPVQLPVDSGTVPNQSADAVAGDSLSKGSKSFVGTVKEVDIDDMRIRVQQGEGGRAKTFKVDKDTQVVNRNGNAVNLDEIEGASVRVQADRNGRAIKITVLRFSIADTPVALPGSHPLDVRSVDGFFGGFVDSFESFRT